MSPENVSPSLAGHRTPLTPCNNPTILDDQIPYLSLCQTDSPLFHYSTNTSSEALPPSSSNASSAIYPYLYSTPPTAGPETPLNGVSVFTAAQESQTIFVGHEGNTGTFCEAHAPQMSTLAPSPYIAAVNPGVTFSSGALRPQTAYSTSEINSPNLAPHSILQHSSHESKGQVSPAASSAGAIFHDCRSTTPMSIHSTPAFDSIDSTICTTPASENTDKWHNEYVRVSRELSALQKQFHGILKENYDLKVENHTLRGDLKWAIGLNIWLPKIQEQVHRATVNPGGATTSSSSSHTLHNNVILPPMPAPVVDQPQNSSAQTKSQNTLLPHSSHGQGGVPVPNFPMQLSVQPAQLSQSQSLIGSSHSHVRQTSAPGDLGPNSSKSARKKRARLEIDQ